MIGVVEVFLMVIFPWLTVHSWGVGQADDRLSGAGSTATT